MEAIFHTDAGDMTFVLLPDKAPIAVKNFVDLATGAFDYAPNENGNGTTSGPYYDGQWFWYVVPDFVIQAGDESGTGLGGLPHEFPDEYHDMTFQQPGLLSTMGRSEMSHGSQFRITLDDASHLDGYYTIFGYMKDKESMAVGREISRGRAFQMRPVRPVFINSIEIKE